MRPQPFASFCASELGALLVWWLLFRAVTGRHALTLASGSVYIRPRWLPLSVLQSLHSRRKTIFATVTAALTLGMLVPSNYQVRCVFALATSMYHLVESSASSRHGEYPWLYISWAWLLPDAWAHAASFGVMVHFVLSSGIAKVIIGGAGWLDARTLKTYLDVYRPSKSSPPLSRRVSQEIAARTWMLQLIGAGTILLECLLIPACLLLPPAYRPLGALAMIGMHFGIGLSMSLEVGLAFTTTLPCYILGFSCDAAVGSAPWVLAVAIGVLPSAVCMSAGGLLPDEWPLTPFSLFMFEGEVAGRIAHDFMTADTRLVLTTEPPPPAGAGLNSLGEEPGLAGSHLEGLRVLRARREPPLPEFGSGARQVGSAESPEAGPAAVHDAVLRVIAFTVVRAGLHPLLTQGAAMPLVLSELTDWLEREQRMVETATGLPLRGAYFVRVSNGKDPGRIAKVLCGPKPRLLDLEC